MAESSKETVGQGNRPDIQLLNGDRSQNNKKSCETNPPTPPYDPKNAVLPPTGGRKTCKGTHDSRRASKVLSDPAARPRPEVLREIRPGPRYNGSRRYLGEHS